MNSMMQGYGATPGPAPQPQGTENQGDFAGAHVDPCDNGYNLACHYDPANPKKGYPQPSRTVHASRQELLKHLDGVLAKHEKSRGKK